MDWVITIPKTVDWSTYQRELVLVEDGTSVMNYKTRYIPKDMKVGDRCYLCYKNKIRGWMEIVGIVEKRQPWKCSTTGAIWPAGKYIQRSGEFHPINPQPEMRGFRGIRRMPSLG